MRSSPQVGFSHAHLPDQELKILGQEWSPRRFRLPTPKEPEAFAVPTDECIRLDIHQRIRPLEHLTQSRHQPASGIVGTSGSGLSLLEKSQLLAQKQIFCGNGPVGTGREESQSDEVHDYQGHCPKAVCHGAENR
jgi:hypothetical protein